MYGKHSWDVKWGQRNTSQCILNQQLIQRLLTSPQPVVFLAIRPPNRSAPGGVAPPEQITLVLQASASS